MFQAFIEHIKEHFPFMEGKALLIAVSGGVDSMVLTDLLLESEYKIGIAHVNFGLRNAESDEDEAFVSGYARQKNIPIYIYRPETEVFAKTHRQSIQVAARELRYKWFYTLLEKEQYDYLLTAHHADDAVETFCINIQRRTGIKGLTGIPAINDKTLRPLLPFSRKEITDYARKRGLNWREDSSNVKNVYLRNQIRHRLIPALADVMPDYTLAFREVSRHLQHTYALASAYVEEMKNKFLTHKQNGEIHFSIPDLLSSPAHESLLFEILQDYGFRSYKDIARLLHAQSGKSIFSPTHRLMKDREELILVVLGKTNFQPVRIEEGQTEFHLLTRQGKRAYSIRVQSLPRDLSPKTGDDCLYADYDKIRFPLLVRNWTEGDFFYPFGMTNKQKLSNFFINRKIPLHEKKNIPLLCDAENRIIWVMGVRPDNRFRITDQTKKILIINQNQTD